MSKRFLFSIFLFLSIFLLGYSQQPQELKTAESLIETDPDSALHILHSLSPNKYKSGANKALYKLLLFQTQNKKKLSINPDSLNFSIDFYLNHPDSDRLATCYLYKGRAYKYASQYEKAVILYLKAQDEAQDSKNNILLGRINFDMGDINNIQGDYVASRQKYQLAYELFSKANLQLLAFYSLVNIGRTYHDTKDYKKAEAYFKKMIPQAIDSVQQGAIYQEIGLNYYDSNNLDSAFHYFRKVLSYPYISNNKAIRYFRISQLFFQLNLFDSAFYYAYRSIHFEPDIRTERECYRILSNSEFKRGNMREMSMYMNKYVNLSDSIRKIDSQIKGSYMETTHKANKEANVNKVQKWISWGVLFLALVGFFFIIKKIFIKVRKEQKEILETHTLEKVGIHKRVIEDKRAVLQKQLEDRKESMLIDFKNAGSQEREFQLRKIYSDLLHFDEPELFYKEMDKFLNRLITKLKKRFSTLNEKELMLCCYLLLQIPTYDMLILFGYKSDNSLKSLKKRLPRKFNLENATLLEDFLLSILSEN